MRRSYYSNLPWWLLPLAVLLATAGCQVLHPRSGSAANTDTYCALPHQVFNTDTLRADGPGRAALPLPLDTTALPGLSARSWQLARAYQLGPALQQLGQLGRGGPASPTYPAFLQQRQALVRQLERTMDEVLRVEEELSCDQQRTDQAAVGLDRLTTTRRNNLTVGSLLAGAASGTVSATLTSDRAATLNLVLTVSTAAVSAALGLATLFVNPKLDYPLPRNLLAPVWYEHPHPALYPAGLWTTLSLPRPGQPELGRTSPLQMLHRRWAQYDQLNTGKPAQQMQMQAVYFGAGGPYQLDDLHTRSAMLTALQQYVRLADQDLRKLLVEVSNSEPR